MHHKFKTLSDGRKIPLVGFGVGKISDKDELEKSIMKALENGYRQFDTAEAYGNEEGVGKAIKKFLHKNKEVKREDIWITTKFLPDRSKGKEDVKQSLKDSLKRLQLDYVDLYLVHLPDNESDRKEQWKAFEQLKEEGLAKSIGVSNFEKKDLEELLKECKHPPVIDQVEVTPFSTRLDLIQYLQSKNIAIQAYSPLTQGKKLSDSKLIDISKKYDVSPAQILLRWSIQKDYIIVVKSTDEDRIRENIDLFSFEIKEEDMKMLDDMNENLQMGSDVTVSQ